MRLNLRRVKFSRAGKQFIYSEQEKFSFDIGRINIALVRFDDSCKILTSNMSVISVTINVTMYVTM